MKLKGLILACLMIASGSANATVATPAVVGAVASAHASHRITQDSNNAIYSVNNALNNATKVIIPCKPQYIGVFDSIVDRELTIEKCEESKKKFERLNGVRYKFGKAVSWDRYNGYFYFELIEIEE